MTYKPIRINTEINTEAQLENDAKTMELVTLSAVYNWKMVRSGEGFLILDADTEHIESLFNLHREEMYKLGFSADFLGPADSREFRYVPNESVWSPLRPSNILTDMSHSEFVLTGTPFGDIQWELSRPPLSLGEGIGKPIFHASSRFGYDDIETWLNDYEKRVDRRSDWDESMKSMRRLIQSRQAEMETLGFEIINSEITWNFLTWFNSIHGDWVEYYELASWEVENAYLSYATAKRSPRQECKIKFDETLTEKMKDMWSAMRMTPVQDPNNRYFISFKKQAWEKYQPELSLLQQNVESEEKRNARELLSAENAYLSIRDRCTKTLDTKIKEKVGESEWQTWKTQEDYPTLPTFGETQ